MKTTLRRLATALALAAGLGVAQAGTTVLDFDNGLDDSLALFPPLLVHNDFLIQGDYFLGTVSTKTGAQDGDFVGALVDGTDVTDTCTGVICPTNNSTQFLAMLDDGLPWLGRLDGEAFQLKSFDASFIAAAGVTVPNVAMLLRVYGFYANGSLKYEDVLVGGPTNGQLGFASFALSDAFANEWFAEIDFYGYACNAQGSCSRSNNLAQFALDNITLASRVPEPASLALAVIALVGAGAARRRSRSV